MTFTEDIIEEGKCPSCGEIKTISFGPDPYASEINDDDTPVWLCEDCYQERAWDI